MEKTNKNILSIKILKIFTILFMCVVLLSSCFMLFACNNKKNREYTTSIDEDNDIALLTLYAFDGKNESKWGLFNLGHSFLSLENTSSDTIKLSNYSLGKGESVTFGTWSILSHFGVWYNVESNYIAAHNKYDGRVSITIGVGLSDIEKINKFIAKNDKWNPINNCSYFAMKCFNEVASDSEKIDNPPFTYTPGYLGSEIKKFKDYQKNREIKTKNTMGYYNGIHYIEYKMEGSLEDF